jgi:hypothetical protein
MNFFINTAHIAIFTIGWRDIYSGMTEDLYKTLVLSYICERSILNYCEYKFKSDKVQGSRCQDTQLLISRDDQCRKRIWHESLVLVVSRHLWHSGCIGGIRQTLSDPTSRSSKVRRLILSRFVIIIWWRGYCTINFDVKIKI